MWYWVISLMKEKIRGSVYGIGLAVALFALISISVLPASTMATYKEAGGSNQETITATASSQVRIVDGNFVLDTTFDPGDDNDGCACYCGQGIVMHDSGTYIDHVVKLTAYNEAETDQQYELIANYHDHYDTWSNDGNHYREDTWYYHLNEVNGHTKSGYYSALYSYYSQIT